MLNQEQVLNKLLESFPVGYSLGGNDTEPRQLLIVKKNRDCTNARTGLKTGDPGYIAKYEPIGGISYAEFLIILQTSATNEIAVSRIVSRITRGIDPHTDKLSGAPTQAAIDKAIMDAVSRSREMLLGELKEKGLLVEKEDVAVPTAEAPAEIAPSPSVNGSEADEAAKIAALSPDDQAICTWAKEHDLKVHFERSGRLASSWKGKIRKMMAQVDSAIAQ